VRALLANIKQHDPDDDGGKVCTVYTHNREGEYDQRQQYSSAKPGAATVINVAREACAQGAGSTDQAKEAMTESL